MLFLGDQIRPSPLLREVAPLKSPSSFPEIEDLGSNPAHTYQ